MVTDLEVCDSIIIFPNLKRVVVMDRCVNLLGKVLRNRWTEEQWTHQSSFNQGALGLRVEVCARTV